MLSVRNALALNNFFEGGACARWLTVAISGRTVGDRVFYQRHSHFGFVSRPIDGRFLLFTWWLCYCFWDRFDSLTKHQNHGKVSVWSQHRRSLRIAARSSCSLGCRWWRMLCRRHICLGPPTTEAGLAVGVHSIWAPADRWSDRPERPSSGIHTTRMAPMTVRTRIARIWQIQHHRRLFGYKREEQNSWNLVAESK